MTWGDKFTQQEVDDAFTEFRIEDGQIDAAHLKGLMVAKKDEEHIFAFVIWSPSLIFLHVNLILGRAKKMIVLQLKNQDNFSQNVAVQGIKSNFLV